MRIVIMGPPGSGKGTVARIISKIYSIPVIATGDMLRDAVVDGNEYGIAAREFMENGELVPDEIVNGIIKERLMKPDCEEGYILDGFPRNLKQADALHQILRKKQQSITHVLNIVLDADAIIQRLSLRRSCSRCGAIYHMKNKPPKVEGICDECGHELTQRSDDREEIIRHRLRVYDESTRPLLERYRKEGVVRQIRGDLPINEIPKKVRLILNHSKGQVL